VRYYIAIIIVLMSTYMPAQGIIRGSEVCYDKEYDDQVRRSVSSMLADYDNLVMLTGSLKDLVVNKSIEVDVIKSQYQSENKLRLSSEMITKSLQVELSKERKRSQRLRNGRAVYFGLGLSVAAGAVILLK
jgi:hypothetical protein